MSKAITYTRNPLCCPGFVNTFLFASSMDEDEGSLESDQLLFSCQMCHL